MEKAQVIAVNEAPKDGIGYRPLVDAEGKYLTNARGQVLIGNQHFQTNSVLMQEEWERIDRAVMEHPRVLGNFINDFTSRGLVEPLPNLGVLQSSWRVSTERRLAEASMDGRTSVDEDRTQRQLQGVPVPIVAAAHRIGWRELLASRNGGAPIDVTEAMEAGRSVMEKLELMLFVGDTSIVVGSNTLYGIYNHPTVASGATAASTLGGGDFGTITNQYPTFSGALAALAGNRYRDQVGVYVSTTQYHQLNLRHTDGSGQTGMRAVMENLGVQAGGRIAWIKEAETDKVPDGQMLVVQLTKDVIDVATALDMTNREWQSPDGQEYFAKVMAAVVPRVKTDASGKVGILRVTGI